LQLWSDAPELQRKGRPAKGCIAPGASSASGGCADEHFVGELKDEPYDERELAMALAGLPSVPEPV
jgi:hypothetical protein